MWKSAVFALLLLNLNALAQVSGPKIKISYFNYYNPKAATFVGPYIFEGEPVQEWHWMIDGNVKGFGNGFKSELHLGRHKVALNIKLKNGKSFNSERAFKVSDKHLVVLGCDFSPPNPDTLKPVYFLAEDRRKPGTELSSTKWDFGDGAQGSGGRTKHNYSKPGVYQYSCFYMDDDGREFSQKFQFRVRDGKNPLAKIRISGVPGMAEREETETYEVMIPPERLKLNAFDEGGEMSPTDVVWDFGDGSTGYGVEVPKTYHHPGDYKIQAEVTYLNKSKIKSWANVSVSKTYCLNSDGQNTCFYFEGVKDGILPSSFKEWVVTNEKGMTPTAPESGSWIYFEGEGGRIDASPYAVIKGNKIHISNGILGKLDSKNLAPLKLVVFAGAVGVSWPVMFGTERMILETSEDQVTVLIENKRAGFQRFIKTSGAGEVVLSDLPPGEYEVRAWKGLRESQRILRLGDGKVGRVAIDLLQGKVKESVSDTVKKREVVKEIFDPLYGAVPPDEYDSWILKSDLVNLEDRNWLLFKEDVRLKDLSCTPGMMWAKGKYTTTAIEIRRSDKSKTAFCRFKDMAFNETARFDSLVRALTISIGDIKGKVKDLTQHQIGLNRQDLLFEYPGGFPFLDKVREDVGVKDKKFLYLGQIYQGEKTVRFLIIEPFAIAGRLYPAYSTLEADLSDYKKATVKSVTPPK